MPFEFQALFIKENKVLPTIFDLSEGNFHGMRNFLANTSIDVVVFCGLFQSAETSVKDMYRSVDKTYISNK